MKKGLFIFALGLVTGICTGYCYAKEKYLKINEDEQKDLLEHYGISLRHDENTTGSDELTEESPREKSERNLHKNDILSYQSLVDRTNYGSYSDRIVEKKEESSTKIPIVKENVVSVISLDDAGTDGYDLKTVNLYTDGTIADEDNEVLNRDMYVGSLDLESILEESEYGDCVYIRNEELKVDLEILKETITYTEAVEKEYGEY